MWDQIVSGSHSLNQESSLESTQFRPLDISNLKSASMTARFETLHDPSARSTVPSPRARVSNEPPLSCTVGSAGYYARLWPLVSKGTVNRALSCAILCEALYRQILPASDVPVASTFCQCYPSVHHGGPVGLGVPCIEHLQHLLL